MINTNIGFWSLPSPKEIGIGVLEGIAESFENSANKIMVDMMSLWMNPSGETMINESAIDQLQNNLEIATGFIAIMSIIIVAAKFTFMNIFMKEDDTHVIAFSGIIRLVIVFFVGTALIMVLVNASDNFSNYIMKQTIVDIHLGSIENASPQQHIANHPALSISISIIAIISSIIQIAILFFRSAMVVLLTGVLPVAASAAILNSGSMMWRKITAWLLAFILYKPVAAICYSAAWTLKTSAESPIISAVEGVVLMVVSLFALPGLLKLLVPAMSSLPIGSSGGGGAAAGGAVATGAAIAATGGTSALASTAGRTAMATGAASSSVSGN